MCFFKPFLLIIKLVELTFFGMVEAAVRSFRSAAVPGAVLSHCFFLFFFICIAGSKEILLYIIYTIQYWVQEKPIVVVFIVSPVCVGVAQNNFQYFFLYITQIMR